MESHSLDSERLRRMKEVTFIGGARHPGMIEDGRLVGYRVIHDIVFHGERVIWRTEWGRILKPIGRYMSGDDVYTVVNIHTGQEKTVYSKSIHTILPRGY